MKRLMIPLAILVLLAIPSVAMAGGACGQGNGGCTTIQDGTLLTSTAEVITLGYDEFGYNYQAHMFNGRYCDYDRVSGGLYCDVTLVMKWNDAWISTKDCTGDGLLDRYYGFSSYIGSGAWLTNHMSGKYVGDDGQEHQWTYFTKIVAKPTAGYNCAAYGGEEIWGAFCTIQSIYNDPYGGAHGVELKAVRPGLGNW